MRARILFSSLLVVLAAGHPAADRGPAGPPSLLETRFASRGPGEVIVPITLGGRGPFRFLLDTGSTHTAISAALAASTAARPVARTSMTAAGGTRDCLVVALPVLSIGPLTADGITATVVGPAAAAVLGGGVEGVLGQDFLSRFSYTIDYRASRIRWHPADYVAPGVRLALVPSQDRWLVELPQDDGSGPAYRFVPDSGADTLVLYGDGLAAQVVREWRDDRVAIGSLTGLREARTGLVGGLRVGAATLDRQLAVVVPGARGEPDGLLPLHLFASVQINARSRCLVIQPR